MDHGKWTMTNGSCIIPTKLYSLMSHNLISHNLMLYSLMSHRLINFKPHSLIAA